MNRPDSDCFALLDDASATDPAQAGSRLYTGFAGSIACHDGADWPPLLAALQEALGRGLYAVSLLSYELGAHLLGTDAQATPATLAQVLLFTQCDHLSAPQVAAWLAARALENATGDSPAGIAALHANIDAAQFSAALARIHELIAAGDTYQVNYTYRLRFDAFGTLPALYARLRARQPVPYGALVALPDGSALMSLSPELFVRHTAGELVARPMKGTAPAANDDDPENARRSKALAADTKNRAENLMIVDLLRNDLGQVAQTGSVDVSSLFAVERYSGVLQMTSTVRAKLRTDASLADIFSALYPCGSITGAPKRRSMEIISEVEPAPRGIYTGAIGWFDPPATKGAIGDFCLSVPIRTLVLAPESDGVRTGEMGVGAGIVYDSDTDDEYAECQLKARFLTGLGNSFELFETIRASHDDGCWQRERHLARLAASAHYFGFAFDAGAAHAALDAACAAFTPGVFYRLRLALNQAGQTTIQSGLLTPLTEPVGLLLADDVLDADDLFVRHKTSIRSRYDGAWRAAEQRGGFDTLFFNQRGELTEGGRSNVFVRIDGCWITPPLGCGVLPGIQRAVLLASPEWQAHEGVITRAMLAVAEDIMVCNALRGPLRAYLMQ